MVSPPHTVPLLLFQMESFITLFDLRMNKHLNGVKKPKAVDTETQNLCIARTRTPVVFVYVCKSFLKIEDKTLFCERLWIRI